MYIRYVFFRFCTMHFNVAVIGGGPAGCGLLCHAQTSGGMPELMEQGIVLFEASDILGAGSFATYANLKSNSHGSAFHESFEAMGLKTSDIDINIDEEVPLVKVGHSLHKLGLRLSEILQEHPKCNVLTNSKVTRIIELVSGNYEILYQVKGEMASITATNICLCHGGIPKIPKQFLPENGSKSIPAIYYLDGSIPKPVVANGKVPSVAIIGLSHTAFSMALKWEGWFGVDAPVTFVSRNSSSPRIYFKSEQEALQHDYAFDSKQDVCAATGRVFRFSGLRGSQREYVLSKNFKKKNIILNLSLGDVFEESDYEYVITATGFKLNENVVIENKFGKMLTYRQNDNGTFVDDRGLLFANHRIFAFGLGSGLEVTSDLGGENSSKNKTRADGVWLYQNTVGAKILDSIKATRVDVWNGIYNRIGSNTIKKSEEVPLHFVGGYEMFNLTQWDAQVEKIISSTDIQVQRTSRIYESGCGAGAFIDSIRRIYGGDTFSGSDLSVECLKICKIRCGSWGDFQVCDCRDLTPHVPEDSAFDLTFQYGVTLYLNSCKDVEKSTLELIRITAPGGVVFVGEINDLDRQELAENMRAKTHKSQTDHLFVPRSFWSLERFPDATAISILDHTSIGLTYATAPYRYSVVIKR